MKTVPQNWLQWDVKEVLPFTGGISFSVRTATPVIIRDIHGLILGYGEGEQEITVTGDGECLFECDTDIWIRPSTRVQERLQRSTEVFTSLDRPAPLSPEMLAIQRMMRKNEMERERDRQEMEKRFADRQHENARSEPVIDVEETPTDKKKKVRANSKSGGDDTSEQIEPDESANADAVEPVGKDAD